MRAEWEQSSKREEALSNVGTNGLLPVLTDGRAEQFVGINKMFRRAIRTTAKAVSLGEKFQRSVFHLASFRAGKENLPGIKMTALERIKQIEAEIFQAAEIENRLRRHREFTSGKIRRLVNDQLASVGLRIERAAAEMRAIEDSNFAQVQMERRNKRYPPVNKRAPIKIFEFEKV